MSFKKVIAISLSLYAFIVFPMNVRKQTVPIAEVVRHVAQSRPKMIVTFPKRAATVPQPVRKASTPRQTIVPQYLQKYTQHAHEYVYREAHGKIMLTTRTTMHNAAGMPYSMYTNCVISDGGKAFVLTKYTSNARDMIESSALVAKEYIANVGSDGKMESNLVTTDSSLPEVPTIGDMVNLHQDDPASYKALLQFAEGAMTYDEIQGPLKKLGTRKDGGKDSHEYVSYKQEGQTYTIMYEFDGDKPVKQSVLISPKDSTQSGLVMEPISSFVERNTDYFPADSEYKDTSLLTIEVCSGLESISRSEYMVEQEASAMRKLNVSDYIKEHSAAARETMLLLFKQKMCGITSFAQLGTGDLNALIQASSGGIEEVDGILAYAPDLARRSKRILLSKQQLFEKAFEKASTVSKQRIKFVEKFCDYTKQCSLDQLYALKGELEASKAVLDKIVPLRQREIRAIAGSSEEIRQRLEAYEQFGGKYCPGFLRRTCNFVWDSVTSDLTEADLLEGREKRYAQARQLQEKLAPLAIKQELTASYLYVVNEKIKGLESGYEHARKAIVEHLPELNELKEHYAHPKNVFEQKIVDAIDATLLNQDEIIIDQRQLDPSCIGAVTSLGVPAHVFERIFASHLSRHIRQYSIDTIEAMHAMKEQLGHSALCNEVINAAVWSCSMATNSARGGEYTKALKLAGIAHVLSDALGAAKESDLISSAQGPDAALHKKAGEYLLAKYIQSNNDGFAEFEPGQGFTLSSIRGKIYWLVREGCPADLIGSYKPQYEQFLAAIAQRNGIAQDVSAPQDTQPSVLPGKPLLDFTQTGPDGSYPVSDAVIEALSAEELKRNLADAQKYLADNARQQEAVGNTAFAKELLDHAQYVGECLTTLGQCTLVKLDEKALEMFKNSLLYPLLQSKLHKHESATKRVLALVEPKYRGAVQEWCAKAGEPLADLLITLFTCKLGSAVAGSNPPAGLAPAMVADGAAVAVVADQAVVAMPIAEIARIVSGLALMNGQGGSGGDASTDHDKVLQQKLVDEKVKKQVEVLKKKATEFLTDATQKELRCEASELAKKYELDLAKVNKHIDDAVNGLKDITHIKRTFRANGVDIEMKTGHSYYRQHDKGGDLRKICSLNEIEDAVIGQTIERLDKIKANKYLKETFDFMGKTIEYEVNVIPGKDSISIDYYPTN